MELGQGVFKMADGKTYDGIFVYNPNNAIKWGLSKINPNGYSWSAGHHTNNRNDIYFDCSSFVDAAYFNGYMSLDTGKMATKWRNNQGLPGFKRAGSPTRNSPRGTILLSRTDDPDPEIGESGHTAIYMGDGQTIQAMSQANGIRTGSLGARFTMSFEPLQGSLYIANWQENYIPSWVNSN